MPYGYSGTNYAAGDYAYTGGNYAAGGIIGSVGKALLSVVKRTPIGLAVSAVSSIVGAVRSGPMLPMIAAPNARDQTGYSVMNVPTTYPGQTALLRMPGFERPDVSGGCMVKGRRLNKSTYVTRGGGTSVWPEQIIIHPKGTECVKSRRMNVTNVRALRRSIRRANGFAKLARKVMTFVNAKAPKGRAKFKRKR